MSTGLVDNWLNIDQFGAIYPFVGSEVVLACVGIAFWIIWHIVQFKKESVEFAQDIKNISAKGGVKQVLAEEADREKGDSVGG